MSLISNGASEQTAEDTELEKQLEMRVVYGSLNLRTQDLARTHGVNHYSYVVALNRRYQKKEKQYSKMPRIRQSQQYALDALVLLEKMTRSRRPLSAAALEAEALTLFFGLDQKRKERETLIYMQRGWCKQDLTQFNEYIKLRRCGMRVKRAAERTLLPMDGPLHTKWYQFIPLEVCCGALAFMLCLVFIYGVDKRFGTRKQPVPAAQKTEQPVSGSTPTPRRVQPVQNRTVTDNQRTRD